MRYSTFSGFWDHCDLDFNAYRLYYQGKMFDAVITYGAYFGNFRTINGQKRRIHKLYALNREAAASSVKAMFLKFYKTPLTPK